MTVSSPSAAAPRRIDRYLRAYGADHQNPTNQMIHWVAVPVIFWCVVAFLTAIPFPHALKIVPGLDWAVLGAILTFIFYLRLSWPLAVAMGVFMAACIAIAHWVAAASSTPLWLIAAVLFAAAWVLQFIGHKIEGRRPSFFNDVRFLLIGPAWLMSFVFRALGLRY